VALAGIGLALSVSACTSTTTTDVAAANEAYCASSQEVLSELSTLKDLVANGDSTRNEISDQGQVVVDAAVAAYRDSNTLSESVRADIQAADKAFRDAIRAIPSTTSTASEAAQAYKAAMDTYNTSIDAVRASQDC
jgi:hypothetical protein